MTIHGGNDVDGVVFLACLFLLKVLKVSMGVLCNDGGYNNQSDTFWCERVVLGCNSRHLYLLSLRIGVLSQIDADSGDLIAVTKSDVSGVYYPLYSPKITGLVLR